MSLLSCATRSLASTSRLPCASASVRALSCARPALAASTSGRPKREATAYGIPSGVPRAQWPLEQDTDTTAHPLWAFFHDRDSLEVPDKRKDNSGARLPLSSTSYFVHRDYESAGPWPGPRADILGHSALQDGAGPRSSCGARASMSCTSCGTFSFASATCSSPSEKRPVASASTCAASPARETSCDSCVAPLPIGVPLPRSDHTVRASTRYKSRWRGRSRSCPSDGTRRSRRPRSCELGARTRRRTGWPTRGRSLRASWDCDEQQLGLFGVAHVCCSASWCWQRWCACVRSLLVAARAHAPTSSRGYESKHRL